MLRILWTIWVIAFGAVVYLIVIRIKTNIANEYVIFGITSGLLIAVMYTSLWRICKTSPTVKKQPINLFEKLMAMLFIAGSILVVCGSVMRAYDRRELESLTTGLCYILAAAAACAYLEERLKSRQSSGETEQAS
jgi:predicted membrane channel-forming protein YqfA (hemolysin III family)